jgi:hypothetical protein
VRADEAHGSEAVLLRERSNERAEPMKGRIHPRECRVSAAGRWSHHLDRPPRR